MLPVLRNSHAFAPFANGHVNRLENLFDRVFAEDGGPAAGQAWASAPVAMWEDDDKICIEAELPGVTEQDLDITVHNGLLYLRGERKPEAGRRYLYNGRTFGRFERVITLPEAVRTEEVEATLTHGVVRINLPKSPEAKPRKVAIKAS